MGSRDRDSKSLQDKLKVFFKKGNVPARSELVVSVELERELGQETPLPRRLRVARDLADRVLQLRVHDGGVERIWRATLDLLEASGPANAEGRHAVLALLRAICEGQGDRLSIMRTVIFRYLRDSHAKRPQEDETPRFKLLHTLTNSGKNITCFEEQVGEFLVEWMPQIQSPALLVEFLQLVTNVVKFNASSLDEHIVHGIVRCACGVLESVDAASGTPPLGPPGGGGAECGDAGGGALALLEAVVSYSLLPRVALPAFLAALCRTVNLEAYTQHSWKLMRCVVGADIGHATLHELVEIARGGGVEEGGEVDAGLVRGAVFYINMALWGPRRVPTLKVSFLAVLPAFLRAVELGQPVVTYEVVVALSALVTRAHSELHEPAWDILLKVIRAVLSSMESDTQQKNELIYSRVHALITAIEQLQLANQYSGALRALLELVDSAGHERPEASTMWLVTVKAAALGPSGGEWTAAALQLADKYLKHEPRRAVRLHTLDALIAYIMRNQLVYGEELVERVGLPVATTCALDAEPGVRAAAARALTDLARVCASDVTADLLDLLEKILNRPFEMYVTDVNIPADADVTDLRLAVTGLLDLLHDKLLRSPAAHPARALFILLDHLDHHYRRPALFHHHPDIRLKIFEMLFGLRVNAFSCVGFCYDEAGKPVYGERSTRLRPLCSPYLMVEPAQARGQVAPSTREGPPLPPGTSVVGGGRAARALIAALTRETDWLVLGAVFRTLPSLLQMRALAVGRRAQDLDMLASTICAMLCDRSLSFPECLRVPAGGKLTLSEFQSIALPPLAALAPYHSFLEPRTQQRIVRCLLRFGMVLRTPQPYINALTIFTLETRETMVKMLPEVLLDLSKISDTRLIASPMLEFLSTLTRLPRVFASFVEDQYMSVFAILLPYTNPSRYNHYVVSLAHHVIAAWFLKCRLSYRRNFVRFIIHGLHNYIILPFEERLNRASAAPGSAGGPALHPAPANEDSSNRQRSSSLGSRAVSRAPLGRGGVSSGASAGTSAASASAAFHVELTETCVDLLSRYAFTPCSVKPHRSDLAEFMFNGGQSTTWLVGHKLVTITTSGCLQHTLKQGLCDRCATLCRQHAERAASPLPTTTATAATATAATATATTATATAAAALQVQSNDSAPASSDLKRQNSGKSRESVNDAVAQLTQRLDRLTRDEVEDGTWSRVGELAGSGLCPCWCAHWAEVHVRSPTGDTAFVARLQNPTTNPHEPLEDVAALLAAAAAGVPLDIGQPEANPPTSAPAPGPAPTPGPSAGVSTTSSTAGPSDTQNQTQKNMQQSEDGSRENSSDGPNNPVDLHKSSSDSVVAADRPHGQPPRMSTQPINIPGSPQRQSSSSTTDDDDMLLIAPSGKARHPVRRSNSSPEMSSWKLREELELRPQPDHMLLMSTTNHPSHLNHPGHSNHPNQPGNSNPQPSKKAGKKNDMRVSCEAIPEEMSGTSPLAQPPAPHPHLMTFNSDPGARSEGDDGAAAGGEKPHHQLQKTASDSVVGAEKPPAGPRAAHAPGRDRDDLPPLTRSKRSNTISVMSPTRRHRENGANNMIGGGPSYSGGAASGAASGSASGSRGANSAGLTPAFVFLQLYHNMSTYPTTPPVPGAAPGLVHPLTERPLKVVGATHERTIKILDLVPPLETYKVGVLYVGPGQQEDEVAILSNEYGSVRYEEFLASLGTVVSLEGGDEASRPDLFLNLETGGKDGKYTYVWWDDATQVQFHVATAMPRVRTDPNCNEKRKHIGNDFVSIVYNDSGADFNITTIKGQLNFCIVVIEPTDYGLNRVLVKTKDDLIRTKFFAHMDTHIVSDANVALLARQTALHCCLASQISQSLKGAAPYASNALERLRLIKRLRRRAEAERLTVAAREPAPYAQATDVHNRVAIDDFNDYT